MILFSMILGSIRPFPINHRPIAINMQCNKIPFIAYSYNEFIISQNSTNFIVHKGDWENSAVFTYLLIYFLKINSVTIQIVNDIDNI